MQIRNLLVAMIDRFYGVDPWLDAGVSTGRRLRQERGHRDPANVLRQRQRWLSRTHPCTLTDVVQVGNDVTAWVS
jgi:hypothetical protein